MQIKSFVRDTINKLIYYFEKLKCLISNLRRKKAVVQMWIDGIKFLSSIISFEDFSAGNLQTGFYNLY